METRQEINRQLAVKAEDNHGYKYDVVLRQAEENGKLLLDVKGTPATWYLSTLLEGEKSDRIYIDVGQEWLIINFAEVMKEAVDNI